MSGKRSPLVFACGLAGLVSALLLAGCGPGATPAPLGMADVQQLVDAAQQTEWGKSFDSGLVYLEENGRLVETWQIAGRAVTEISPEVAGERRPTVEPGLGCSSPDSPASGSASEIVIRSPTQAEARFCTIGPQYSYTVSYGVLRLGRENGRWKVLSTDVEEAVWDPPPQPTPMPIPQPTDTPSPAPPTDTPLPPPPTDTPVPTPVAELTPIPPEYVVAQEEVIGDYTVQLWTASSVWATEAADYWEGPETGDIVTLSAGGRILAQHELVWYLDDPLLGTDITGEGNPDVVFWLFTHGAHCCHSTVVYDLGPTLTKVLETPFTNCDGWFEDLDGDGAMEYLTCDDLFAYAYCSYGESPMVNVVLDYEPGRGYVPASPRFPQVYADDLAKHQEWAENPGLATYPGGWDDAKCSVLWLVLDYLYMGDPDRAWAELDRLYPRADKYLFWAEVVKAVSASWAYASSAPLPAVSETDYYMLQLTTGCGPDQPLIGLLQEGQQACDAGMLTREPLWLTFELARFGLLAGDELLILVPEGCTADCRLEIVGMPGGEPRGWLDLDTSAGFPGEVYRINEQESPHYRLRGDLAWELVP